VTPPGPPQTVSNRRGNASPLIPPTVIGAISGCPRYTGRESGDRCDPMEFGVRSRSPSPVTVNKCLLSGSRSRSMKG